MGMGKLKDGSILLDLDETDGPTAPRFRASSDATLDPASLTLAARGALIFIDVRRHVALTMFDPRHSVKNETYCTGHSVLLSLKGRSDEFTA
jgi:hypothetical protein